MRAWVYTGPLGHLAAGISDWAALLARFAWSRIRRRASGYAHRTAHAAVKHIAEKRGDH